MITSSLFLNRTGTCQHISARMVCASVLTYHLVRSAPMLNLRTKLHYHVPVLMLIMVL